MTRKRHDCAKFQHDGICLKCLESDKHTKYMRQYRITHPVKKYQDEYNKKYYMQKKDKIILRTRQYYEEHKDTVSARKKEYNKENEEYFRALRKKYWRDNKHILGPKSKARYEANKEQYNKKTYQNYKKPRYHSDPAYRLSECIAAGIRGSFKYSTNKKNTRTAEYVGCTMAELKNYLEKLFLPGMSWNNFGRDGWSIDHITPQALFAKDDSSQKRCWHYTNLRPYWLADNIRKSVSQTYLSDAECEVLMDIFNKKILECDKMISDTYINKCIREYEHTHKYSFTETDLESLFTIIIGKSMLSEPERVDLAIRVLDKMSGPMTEVRPHEEPLQISREPDVYDDDRYYIVYPGYVDGPNRAVVYKAVSGTFEIAT